MHEVAIIRSALLLIPLLLGIMALLSDRFNVSEKAGAFLAFNWVFVFGLITNIIAIKLDWWGFASYPIHIYDVPIDFVLGLSLLLGGIIQLLNLSVFINLAITSFTGIIIYNFSGLVVLGEDALVGFALTIMIVIIPAYYLSKFTREKSHIYIRATLQPIIWVLLLIWLFPSVVLIYSERSWDTLIDLSNTEMGIHAILLSFPGYLIVNSLYVFARHGKGTAFPFDPPQKLVVQGVYAYVSNPMQIGICLTMAILGLALKSVIIFITAPMALFLFIVFKDICNGSSNVCGSDRRWDEYHKKVPKWIPNFAKLREGDM